MTTFIGWTPPPGVEVVPPPVHPETKVAVIYSDGEQDEFMPARCLNWSAEGDGPRVVAYAVVEEYKPAPEPREWWAYNGIMFKTERAAIAQRKSLADWYGEATAFDRPIIHVREVLPGREVVAWGVVGDHGPICLTFFDDSAEITARENNGTVVRLSGVMPNE